MGLPDKKLKRFLGFFYILLCYKSTSDKQFIKINLPAGNMLETYTIT